MASGFQLDNSQITPGLYRVSISMNTINYPAYSGSGNVAANQGGVNPYDWDQGTVYTGGLPTNAGYAQALAQGNLRWNYIVQLLSSISDARILDIVVTTGGASGNYQPTGLSFTVAFDRDQGILTEYSKMQAANSATASGYYVVTNGTASTSPIGASTTYTGYANLAALQTAGFSGADNVRVFQSYLGQDGATAIQSPQGAIQDILTTAICTGGTSGIYKSYRVFSVTQNGDSQVNVTINQPTTPATVFGTLTVNQIGTTGISY
jgi:hypothetical protein